MESVENNAALLPETIHLLAPSSPRSISIKSKRLRCEEVVGFLSDSDDSEQEEFTGYGTLSFWNGDSYEGNVVDSKMSGVGILRHTDGGFYKGQFERGVKCGWGITVWPDGKKHIGRYFNDMPNGQGTVEDLDGGRTTGTWVNGQLTILSVTTTL
eukprot:CAMPEP_0198316318 /NCGR_PEP_ID=MMETSP1450-20131203/6257_1 /TAXON_ID=753684 ORGANISM="Madagascaria erythrocladiodes, Strain CCMP3234" /NCGR_SAMPLE_ID=MMETSP1450 /ASSEMBLY_ACC=CAM_ASM_001115 /LENGTH=154 /DNA_ID=CAMNT_0044019469 /DNA_START=179 /DNA_END=643 /DNA_ORIENTATION=+